MAAPALNIPLGPESLLAEPRETGWRSGEVHGPVAEMHRTLERKLRLELDSATSDAALGPVDRLLRVASRALGWSALVAAFGVTGFLLR